MPSDKDIVVEARELLETELPDSVHSIEHALWADAIERQSESPFWGHSKAIATAYARAPKLLRALADEVERLRKQTVMLAQDARHDAQAAADEAYWRDKQGDEYGSY